MRGLQTPQCSDLCRLALLALQGAPKLKVAIVGSGLAGLSTAVELLDQGYDVDVFESRPFIGGKVASWQKDGNHVEMGLHVVRHWSLRSSLHNKQFPDHASRICLVRW